MKQFSRIFAIPALIATISMAGLISALIGNGWMDWLSWLSLAAPVIVIAVIIWRAASAHSSDFSKRKR